MKNFVFGRTFLNFISHSILASTNVLSSGSRKGQKRSKCISHPILASYSISQKNKLLDYAMCETRGLGKRGLCSSKNTKLRISISFGTENGILGPSFSYANWLKCIARIGRRVHSQKEPLSTPNMRLAPSSL